MAEQPLSPFTRRRIAQLAEDALRRAEVVDVFPTPLQAVQRAVDLRSRVDVAALPDEVRAAKPRLLKRILGAVWFEERTVFIDTSLSEPRQRFTDGHEATHAMCPWHAQTLALLDTEDELVRRSSMELIEAEANYGSGHLIFQGGRFHRQALQDQVSIRVPLALAKAYGASRNAAVHYYAQEHPDAVALLVAGVRVESNGTIPIWRSVESPSFAERFGRLTRLLPGGQLKVIDGEDAPLAGIVTQARLAVDPPSVDIGVPDLGGHRRPCVAEAFNNGYVNLILVAERRARRLGRRTRLAG